MMQSITQKAAIVMAAFFIAIGLSGGMRGRRGEIAVIPPISSDARWLSFHVGIGEAAEQFGLKAHWSGPSEESNTIEQIELTRQAIEHKAYGIILEPSSLVATNNVIRKAQDQRIPVVIITEGQGVPEGEHLYHISNDTNETGKLAARRVEELVHQSGEVAIFGLRSEIPGNIERADAIAESLRRYCPELQVVEKSMVLSSISSERREAREYIRAHPRLKAIITLTPQESFAIAAAVRAENAMHRIKIIGCDQTLTLFLMLRAGAIDSLVVQDMRTMGRLAVDMIAKDREGLHAPAVSVVKPILVSAENIDSEAVQQAILMHKGFLR